MTLVFVPALDKLQDLSGCRYQIGIPGIPLAEPTIHLVTQSPYKPPGCGMSRLPLTVELNVRGHHTDPASDGDPLGLLGSRLTLIRPTPAVEGTP